MMRNRFFICLIKTIFTVIYIIYYLLCLIYAFINKFYEEYIFFLVTGFIFIAISFFKYFIYRRFNIRGIKELLFFSIPIIFVVLLFNCSDILECLVYINSYSVLKLFSCITIMLSMSITYILGIMNNYYIIQEKKLSYKHSKLPIDIIIYIVSVLAFLFANNVKILDGNILYDLFIYTVVNSILIIICYLPLRYAITRIDNKGIALLAILCFMYLIYGLLFFMVKDIDVICWLLGTIMFIIICNFFYDLYFIAKIGDGRKCWKKVKTEVIFCIEIS